MLMKKFSAKMDKDTLTAISEVRRATGLGHSTDLLAVMARIAAEAVRRAELQRLNTEVAQEPLPEVEEESSNV